MRGLSGTTHTMTDVEPLSKPGPPGMKQGGPGAMGNDGIPSG
jgi:hypothetical protein